MHHSVNNAHAAAVYASLTGHDRGDNTPAIGGGSREYPAIGSVLGKLRPPEQHDRAARLPALHHQGRRRRAAAAGLLRRLAGPGLRSAVRAQGSERAGFRRARVDAAGRRFARAACAPGRHCFARSTSASSAGRAARLTTAWTGSAAGRSSLLTSAGTQQALRIGDEPDEVRERYGRNIYGQSVLLARRLIEAGTRMVTISWAPDANATWDTHGTNFKKLKNTLLPQFDAACAQPGRRPGRARHARPHAGRGAGRFRPLAQDQRQRRRPRPLELLLQPDADRRRRAKAASSTAPATRSAPSRPATPWCPATSSPRSITCWASRTTASCTTSSIGRTAWCPPATSCPACWPDAFRASDCWKTARRSAMIDRIACRCRLIRLLLKSHHEVLRLPVDSAARRIASGRADEAPPEYPDHRRAATCGATPQGEHPVEDARRLGQRRAHISAGHAAGDGQAARPLEARPARRASHRQRSRARLHAADARRSPPTRAIACRATCSCPTGLEGKRVPGILALHQTTPTGKGQPAGLADSENLHYGLELAKRGYVVLVPDYPSFGDYKYDFNADTYTSGSMKGIFNHMRAVDLLASRPEVDPAADRRDRPFAGRAQRDVRRRVRRAHQGRSSRAAAGRRCTTTTAASSKAGPATATCRRSATSTSSIPTRCRSTCTRSWRRWRRGRSSRTRRCTTATSTSAACARRSPRPSRSTICSAPATDLQVRYPDCRARVSAAGAPRGLSVHRPHSRAHAAARICKPSCRAFRRTSRPTRWQRFKILPGFRIEQVAAEPLVSQPGGDGVRRRRPAVRRRNARLLGAGQGAARPACGCWKTPTATARFDKATIFADELSWPTAVTCYDGGVFVGAAPDIYYLKDTDGDGKADVHKLVFTGFGRGNVQGLFNSFQWGLDNRIHGAASSPAADWSRGPTCPTSSRSRSAGAISRSIRARSSCGPKAAARSTA